MRKARFTEHQIIAVLKSVEAGRTVKDVCREAGISEASYYNWKAKFGGMEASDIKKMKDLEDENRRLKQMFADLSLECRALKDVIEKNFKTSDKAWAGQLSDRTVCHELTSGMQDIVAEQDGISLSAGYATG
ncbi:Transposase [Klebsiella pneumoniae subsp. pneumoniae 1084]|nr:Transposase [Klebsiella pneumoniae subsp. pneumoniae 1084]